MINLNVFKRNKKYISVEKGSCIGRYAYGVYKNWLIDEHYDESTEELYYTIEGVDEKFAELSDAEEVLYNLYHADDKLTEGY